MSETSHVHEKIVIDSDVHFTIDTTTRMISNRNADKVNKKLVLTQYDNKSERYSFDVDRYIDGHDLMLCNRVQVHFINIASKTQKKDGVYLVDDVHINESDENKISFSWLISRNATMLSGYLSFLVAFSCVDGDTILYRWSTTTYDAIQVVTGLDNSNAVVEEYVDELLTWENTMQNELASWQNRMETDVIPILVDECYIEREFATSDEVALIFDMYSPVEDSIIDIEDTPTDNSINLVRSGGIKKYTDDAVSEAITESKTYTDSVMSELDNKGYLTETDLNNKGYLTEVPSEYITETELNNKGYLTEVPSEYVTETELNNKGYLKTVPSEYVTETELNNKGYLKTVPSEYVTETELDAKLTELGSIDTSNFVDKTTNQSIGGQKTFTNKVTFQGEVHANESIASVNDFSTKIANTIFVNRVVLEKIYPVGSIYMSTQNVSPASFIPGTSWYPLPEGYALWTTKTNEQGGKTISAGIPNIFFRYDQRVTRGDYASLGNARGAISYHQSSSSTSWANGWNSGDTSKKLDRIIFSADRGECGTQTYPALSSEDIQCTNKVYGKSDTVQPPAIKIYAWQRLSTDY